MLKYRLITGILVAAFFLAAILFAPVWVLVVMLGVVYFLAQLEYCEMCEAGGYKLERIGIFACGLLFLGATVYEMEFFRKVSFLTYAADALLGRVWEMEFFGRFHLYWHGHSPTETLLYLVPAFLATQSVLRRKTERAAECLGLSLLGFWYVAVLMSFMVRLIDGRFSESWESRIFLILFIVLVKMSDIGAYTFGSLWGHKIKRRLIPEISPAKSIPGLIGAYVGSLFAAGVLALGLSTIFGIKIEWCNAIALGVLMATAGVLGDLVESLLKRSFGVKDSSSRFPGMGGFLDIIDSLLFAAPFMYFFMKWFL